MYPATPGVATAPHRTGRDRAPARMRDDPASDGMGAGRFAPAVRRTTPLRENSIV